MSPKPFQDTLLFIHNAGFGDAIMASPALYNLKKYLPNWKLCVLTRANAVGYLKTLPFVDEVLSFVSEKWLDRWPWGLPVIGLLYARLLQRLHRYQFQTVIQWRGQPIDTVASFATGAPIRVAAISGLIRKSVLPVEKIPFMITHLVPIEDERMHIVEYYMEVAVKAIDLISSQKPADLCWNLQVPFTLSERESITSMLSTYGLQNDTNLVAVSVGSRTETNFWSLSNFAQVADHIQKHLGARVVLTGVQSQIQSEQAMISYMQTMPIPTCGKLTLGELAALLERCKLVITLNSGAMHVAAAVKTPTFVLFGRDGAAFTPWQTEYAIVTKNPYYPKRHPDPRQWSKLVELIQPEEVITTLTQFWADKCNL